MGVYATDEVRLSEILKPKCIDLDLKGKDKPKIIAELAELLVKSGKARNKKALAECLIEREKLGSTAIGNGVAIPHAKIDDVKEPVLVFGRCPGGVEFNSLDGEKTYLFFMLVSSREDVGIHLKILAKISHLIKDKFTVGLFRRAKSKDEVLKIVSDIEKHL